jgi:tetratricopeptide (TPR) repeat protein
MVIRWRKLWMVLLALLVTGAIRMPFERAFTRELQAVGLLSPPLEIDTRDRIGQTSSAVALGGLRTLVATFLNLRAFTYFEDRAWDDVYTTYCTVVDLAPRTGYYWEAGAHHQAMNAAAYFLRDEQLDLSPIRREAAARAAVRRGRAFVERGIRNNPNDWRLHRFLGLLLMDRGKYRMFGDPDETFQAAAIAYRAAAACPDALPYIRRFELYALARVASRRDDALAMVRKLYADPGNRVPTLRCIYFALEMQAGAGVLEPVEFAIQVFGSAESAHRDLGNYWLRGGVRLPIDGVALALKGLEERLNIAPDMSVLQKRPVASSVDE